MASWRTRGDRGYARKLGEPEENTYDFHDVLVLPRYRGRGMHTRFLNLFEEMARSHGRTRHLRHCGPRQQRILAQL